MNNCCFIIESKKIRSRIKGELTKRAILATSKQKKRSRSFSVSSIIEDKEKKKNGKKARKKQGTQERNIHGKEEEREWRPFQTVSGAGRPRTNFC